MFDWNDEELTNIIWGEAGETDDHIVPYQEGNENYRIKKEWSQEATSIKPTERKTQGVKIDFNGQKLESISNINSNERTSSSGFGMHSWADLSLSDAAKADKDSMCTEVTDNVAETTKFNLTSNVKAELDKDPEIFQNPNEGKDQGDFVDYSWDNIGSFDDLDRIFSNDDPIFGHVNLGNADELWSSSKDVSNSPVKFFPLPAESPSLELGALENTSDHVEIKSEFEQDEQSLTVSHGKLNSSTLDLQNAQGILDHVEYPGGNFKSIVKEQIDLNGQRNSSASDSGLVVENVATLDNFADKGYRQKNLLKGRKKLEEKNEGKLSQDDMYGTWSPSSKHENQLSRHSMLQSSPSSVLSQQRQLEKSETLQYQEIPRSFATPSAYRNLTNPYPAMPVLAHVQSGEFKNQSLLSGYEVSPGKANSKQSAAAPTKPLTMTPQEKIEKLRRRQQMRAMLAIQKQQLQLSHQVSPRDHSRPPKFLENQMQHIEGADLEVEDISTLPAFDTNSPIEQDDSNTSFLAVDNISVEDTILYRLQDVIAKLDVRIRLCIRDSLFRLAQSAMQRHYASDMSSNNKSSRDEPEVIATAEANSACRYTRMPDAETETNPIDRTVAHLLFHGPLELSGKHPETPDSPASSKFPFDRGTMSLLNLPTVSMPESSKIMQNFSHQVSKDPCRVPEHQHVDQFKSSSCLDTSENASNCGTADIGAAEVSASQ